MGTDMLLTKLPAALQRVALALGYGLMLFVTWLMFEGSLAQTRINWDAEAPVTGLSMAWIYSAGVVFSVASGAMLTLDLWKVLTGRLTLVQLHMPQGLEPTGADLAAHPNKN
jgi:TRAP-type C4-dicarboxylate transport system permease small subunit